MQYIWDLFHLINAMYLSQFVEERDSCALPFQKPVYELFAGKLWPVVCIEKVSLLAMSLCSQEEGNCVKERERGLCIELDTPAQNAVLFVAAPLVEARGEQRPPLIEM